MQVKDQIRARMESLGISYRQLALRCEVSEQTVRFWTSGRSYPKKARIPALEKALSFKLDFGEGQLSQGVTVESTMEASDIELFLKLRRMPVIARMTFEKLVDLYLNQQPTEPFLDRSSDAKITPFKQRAKPGLKNDFSSKSSRTTRKQAK